MSAQFPMVLGEDKRELPARFLQAEEFLAQQPDAVTVEIYHKTLGQIDHGLTYDADRQGWFYEFSAAEITAMGAGVHSCRFRLSWLDGRVRYSPTVGKDSIKVEAKS